MYLYIGQNIAEIVTREWQRESNTVVIRYPDKIYPEFYTNSG